MNAFFPTFEPRRAFYFLSLFQKKTPAKREALAARASMLNHCNTKLPSQP